MLLRQGSQLLAAEAYVQILLRDAVRHPWPLNENIPVFDTLSRIYTSPFSLFDLA